MEQTDQKIRIVVVCVLIAVCGIFFHKPVAKNSPIVLNQTQVPAVAVQPPAIKVPAVNLGKRIQVPILTYHHVGFFADTLGQKPDPLAMGLTVSPQDFESQVQYFKNLGYTSVSLAQAYDALESNGSLPAHPIVFTFDDGYKDVFVYAVPILLKYGYTGTFAVAANLLGRPTYAVWDDVISAQKSGMEIVSHTENHLDLTNPIYSDADLHREIFDSKQILEEKLSVPVDFFVYPYGKYNGKVEELVKEAGYKMAFTTAFGLGMGQDNLLTEPRVRVHGQDGLEGLKRIFSPPTFQSASRPSVGTIPRSVSVQPNL